jgi:dihydrolipoamide dehydrogenase
VAAIRAAQLGAQVALIEERELGGTCLNRGCIPTKALLASANVYENLKEAERFGLTAKEIGLNWAKIYERKDQVVSQQTKGLGQLLKANKVEILNGRAQFSAPGTLMVTAPDGQKQEVKASKIIIATGSEAARPEFLKVDGVNIITSEEALNLKTQPQSLLIIGGGVVGCEFAGFFASLGTQVTMVEMLPQILPLEDPQVVRILAARFKKKGLTIYAGAKVEDIKVAEGQVISKLDNGQEIRTQKVLVSIGRKLNSDNCGLDKAGVAVENNAVVINKRMETNVPGHYAIGDVTGKILLAHTASSQGQVAAANALGGRQEMDYGLIPNCIYTWPEIASVGFSEDEAKNEGYEIKVGRFNFGANGKAQAIGETEGFVKIVAEAPSDEILGVQIVGPHATDLMAEAVLALKARVKARELGDLIHAHPTLSEAIMEAAHDVHGISIHKMPGLVK